MQNRRSGLYALAALVAVGAVSYGAYKVWEPHHGEGERPGEAAEAGAAAVLPADPKRALHAINRLTFGPRPSDVMKVVAMGVEPWIAAQLDAKADESALEARLAPLRTVRMKAAEIIENFPTKLMVRNVARGRHTLPDDPYQRAVLQVQVDRYNDRSRPVRAAGDAGRDEPASEGNGPDDEADEMAAMDGGSAAPVDAGHAANPRALAKAKELMAVVPVERMKSILQLPPADQRALADLGEPEHRRLMDGMPPKDKETFLAMGNVNEAVADELIAAKLLRAVYGERQLEEVMTDFWFNHFNVYIGKGADAYQTTAYERDTIRPHVLGKFEDLLVATAQSPAMMVYLDNWQSVGPGSPVGLKVPENAPRRFTHRRRHDLNENYGRELLELHTLGVDGGYTQKDVRELARVFTGWTVAVANENGGEFRFDDSLHDPGEKTILGHTIHEGGKNEGLDALHFLAHHPSTAKFVCTKLAARFVSDDPPASLVDALSRTFLEKDGDIREVLRTLFKSPEFWAPAAYRAKVKTPLEFVVSSLRATAADVKDATSLIAPLNQLGMPLYGMRAPTGYSMKASAWLNSAALLARVNFVLDLAGGKIAGVSVTPEGMLEAERSNGAQADLVAAMERALLANDVSPQTHDAVVKGLADARGDAGAPVASGANGKVVAVAELILESPEFERR